MKEQAYKPEIDLPRQMLDLKPFLEFAWPAHAYTTFQNRFFAQTNFIPCLPLCQALATSALGDPEPL